MKVHMWVYDLLHYTTTAIYKIIFVSTLQCTWAYPTPCSIIQQLWMVICSGINCFESHAYAHITFTVSLLEI